MRTSNVRFLFASTSLLAAASGALAQSSFVQHGEIIAATGDLVPGLTGGEIFGGSSTFDTGVMDDNGMVFFRGRFTGATVQPTSDRGLFYGSNRSNLQLVLRSGDAEPSGTIPGATMNTATGTGINGALRISKNGIMMFATAFQGGGVQTTDDSALYVGTPGNFQVLAREGGVAVGTAGATYSSFSSLSQQFTSLNEQGRVLFQSTLLGGDVSGTTNNAAWFTGTAGSLVLMQRKGDLGPGGEVTGALGFVSQMNASGQVMFDVSYVLGSAGGTVTASNDKALWLYTPGIGSIQIIREGDMSPLPSVAYNVGSNSWSVNTGSTTFNAAGEGLLRVDLAGAVTVGVDDSAVLKVSASGHTIMARRGDAVAAIPGTFLNTFNNTSLQLNDSGRVAFQASLTGAVTTTSDSAILSGTDGNYVLVAHEGDAAPGLTGFTFGDVSGQAIQQNNAGQLLFANTISDGVNGFSSHWSWDPTIGLQLVGMLNDTIETSPGVPHQYGSTGGIQFSNGAGRPLTFRDNGDFTHRVNFQDGTAAQMIAHVGSFVGTPAIMTATAGGLHSMYLNAGAAQAGNTYLVLGSASGTAPGFPAGVFTCPLNPDLYFNLTILYANTAVFANTIGVLDASGKGSAVLSIPAGVTQLTGLTLSHAFLTFNPFGAVKFASEADGVTFTP